MLFAQAITTLTNTAMLKQHSQHRQSHQQKPATKIEPLRIGRRKLTTPVK